MKLTAYPVGGSPVILGPGTSKRDWMEQTDKFAQRCLPMLIANQHGWMIAFEEPVAAAWNGENSVDSMEISGPGISVFGFGVVTFQIPILFKTEPGWNLWVKGPSNHIKRGIHALEGIVETDWAAATFTMNWKFDSPGEAFWEPYEPCCMICPVPRVLDDFDTELKSLKDEPELEQRYADFTKSRINFYKERIDPRQWERHYHKGQDVDGTKHEEHQHKLNLKTFE